MCLHYEKGKENVDLGAVDVFWERVRSCEAFFVSDALAMALGVALRRG